MFPPVGALNLLPHHVLRRNAGRSIIGPTALNTIVGAPVAQAESVLSIDIARPLRIEIVLLVQLTGTPACPRVR
jgi:hypothetical protein